MFAYMHAVAGFNETRCAAMHVEARFPSAVPHNALPPVLQDRFSILRAKVHNRFCASPISLIVCWTFESGPSPYDNHVML